MTTLPLLMGVYEHQDELTFCRSCAEDIFGEDVVWAIAEGEETEVLSPIWDTDDLTVSYGDSERPMQCDACNGYIDHDADPDYGWDW